MSSRWENGRRPWRMRAVGGGVWGGSAMVGALVIGAAMLSGATRPGSGDGSGPAGACCLDKGSCLDLPEVDCMVAGGDFQGEGTSCVAGGCLPGACCFSDGSCIDTLVADCTAQGGVFQGPSTLCLDIECPILGACCFPDGNCGDGFDQFTCEKSGGGFQGVDTSCFGIECPILGACCYPDGSCADGLVQSKCEAGGGVFQGAATFCFQISCPIIGACCFPDGSCEDGLDEGDCGEGGGVWQGATTLCLDIQCPIIGACCFDGDCADGLTQPDCEVEGGTFQGGGTFCSGLVCPYPGACCLSNGACLEITEPQCTGVDGVFAGEGTSCSKQDCLGACCLVTGACVVVSQIDCASAGSTFHGVGTFCDSSECALFVNPVETSAADLALGETRGQLDAPAGSPLTGGAGAAAAGREVALVIPGDAAGGPGRVQVFVNRGTDASGGWMGFASKDPIDVGDGPAEIAVARLNGDDFNDLAVANKGGNSIVILENAGDGEGTFMVTGTITGPFLNQPVAVAAADFFGGGPFAADLAVANAGDNTVIFLENNGDGTFGLAGPTIPIGGPALTALDPIDLDNDKNVDLVPLGGNPTGGGPGVPAGQVTILRNLGGAVFADPIVRVVGANAVDLAFGDIDGNGYLDILTANKDDASISIIYNDGPAADPEASFAQAIAQPVGDDPVSVEAVDIDGDGDVDVAVAATDPTVGPAVQVLLNQSGGAGTGSVFAPPMPFGVGENGTPAAPNAVVALDANLDGAPDLVTANEDLLGPTAGSVSTLLNSAIPEFDDCNGNLVPDVCDIATGTSADCNGNGIPDECDTAVHDDPATAQPQDDCADAELVCPYIQYEGDTTGATNDGDPFCGLYVGLYDVWYRYRPRWTGTAFVSIFSSPMNPVLTIYDGCPDAGGQAIRCNNQNPWGVAFTAHAAATYWIRIAGLGYSQGPFTMSLVGPECLLNEDDANGNGIPDECECPADVNGDGFVDEMDFVLVMLSTGHCPDPPADCPGDVDGSGDVNENDLREVLLHLGPCPEMAPAPSPSTREGPCN